MCSMPFDPQMFADPAMTSGGEPTWEVACLFPCQGQWTESEYLALTASSRKLVELVDGRIEVLAMPKISHQLIVRFLFDALRVFVESRNLGIVFFAPTYVRIRKDHFREPDVVFQRLEKYEQSRDEFLHCADLVMEVVSPDAKSVKRDHEEKRRDYAAAGIAEYWIVDPQLQTIEVLALDGDAYVEVGRFTDSQAAKSRLLDGLTIDVAATFAAGKR